MQNVKNVWYPLCSPIEPHFLNATYFKIISSLVELGFSLCQLTVGSSISRKYCNFNIFENSLFFFYFFFTYFSVVTFKSQIQN